jgi:hypothetical protein
MEIKGRLKQQRSKSFICREEKGKAAWGRSCSGIRKLVVPWVRLETGFYSFFYCPRAEILAWTDVKGEVFKQMFFWGRRRGVFSPWLIDTFWEYMGLLQSALQTRKNSMISG